MIYLIGIGNYTMYDDSIGIRVIEYIVENQLDQGVVALDLSSNLYNVFTYLNEKARIMLFIDSALMGLVPGDYRIFPISEVQTHKKINNISTHEGDVLKVLELAKQMDYPLPEVYFMGIEPEVHKLEIGLSKKLEINISKYAEAALKWAQHHA